MIKTKPHTLPPIVCPPTDHHPPQKTIYRFAYIILHCIFLSTIAILFSSTSLHAQFSLNGYIRDMQTETFAHPDSTWLHQNMFHNRLNFKYSPDTGITFVAEIRNRLVWSSQDPVMSKKNDAGLVNASWLVFSNKSAYFLTQADRFYAEWNTGKWTLTAGRQRINWSQAFVWTPNDIFNNYSWFDFDYDERSGCDAVRIQYHTTASSRVDMAVKADSAGKITAGGLYAFGFKGYDIQVLGGYFAGSDWVGGAGFAGTLGKGSLRGECSYFHPSENFTDTGGVVLASLGYDIMFSNSLMLQAEVLYNGNKRPDAVNPGQMLFMVPSAKNIFVPGVSLFASASYPVNPLFTTGLSAMALPEYKTVFAGPSLSYSLSDNSSLMFTSYFFSELKEFNGYNRLYMFFVRYGYSF